MEDTRLRNAELVEELRAWADILRKMDGEPVQLILYPSMAALFEEAADALEEA